MDTTDLRAALESLAAELTGLHERPADREAWIAAAIAGRDALDEIRDAVDDLDDELAGALDDAQVVTKRCAAPDCRRWMRVATTGRPREYCRGACKAAAARRRVIHTAPLSTGVSTAA